MGDRRTHNQPFLWRPLNGVTPGTSSADLPRGALAYRPVPSCRSWWEWGTPAPLPTPSPALWDSSEAWCPTSRSSSAWSFFQALFGELCRLETSPPRDGQSNAGQQLLPAGGCRTPAGSLWCGWEGAVKQGCAINLIGGGNVNHFQHFCCCFCHAGCPRCGSWTQLLCCYAEEQMMVVFNACAPNVPSSLPAFLYSHSKPLERRGQFTYWSRKSLIHFFSAEWAQRSCEAGECCPEQTKWCFVLLGNGLARSVPCVVVQQPLL